MTMKTTPPTLSELQAQVPYPLRADLVELPKPFVCDCCRVPHSYLGCSLELFVPGSAHRREVRFCVLCVADGRAYREVVVPSRR